MALLKWYLCPPNRGDLPTQLCVMPTLSQSVIAQYNTQYNAQCNAQYNAQYNALYNALYNKHALARYVRLIC